MSAEGPGESPEWIEQGLREALQRDGNKIISSLYNDRNLLPDEQKPLPCETCYPKRTRRIQTLFGEIILSRNYHHHPASGTGRHPLDDILCLERGCTPAVARLICRAASLSPSYQRGAQDLAAYAQLEFDARDLGRMVEVVAPSLEDALTSIDPAQPAAPVPVLYVSIDGTGTPMRREELVGRRGKQEDGSARTREAKLACVFTQTSTDEKGRPMRNPDSTSYVGTFQGCREAGVLLHQEAIRRGLGLAGQVVYLGDGAAWVWENCRLTFPGAVEILDFYHASEHVSQLAKAIHDNDPEAAEKRHRQWNEQMKQSSPAALLTESRTLLVEHHEWPEAKRDAIQSEINYLENHSTRTHYGEYRDKGYFIGSGVIEAGCKTVVGARLKQSGMFWSEKGAQNILSLRCLIIGPHFDTTWTARRTLLAESRIKARRWLREDEIKAA